MLASYLLPLGSSLHAPPASAYTRAPPSPRCRQCHRIRPGDLHPTATLQHRLTRAPPNLRKDETLHLTFCAWLLSTITITSTTCTCTWCTTTTSSSTSITLPTLATHSCQRFSECGHLGVMASSALLYRLQPPTPELIRCRRSIRTRAVR